MDDREHTALTQRDQSFARHQQANNHIQLQYNNALHNTPVNATHCDNDMMRVNTIVNQPVGHQSVYQTFTQPSAFFTTNQQSSIVMQQQQHHESVQHHTQRSQHHSHQASQESLIPLSQMPNQSQQQLATNQEQPYVNLVCIQTNSSNSSAFSNNAVDSVANSNNHQTQHNAAISIDVPHINFSPKNITNITPAANSVSHHFDSVSLISDTQPTIISYQSTNNSSNNHHHHSNNNSHVTSNYHYEVARPLIMNHHNNHTTLSRRYSNGKGKYIGKVIKGKVHSGSDGINMLTGVHVNGKCKKLNESERKTFNCPTCDRVFTEKFNMKRHMQIHSQSRPKYICTECSKSFMWKDNFIRHKKAAHRSASYA